MTEYLTAHESLEVLVNESPVRFVRGGIAQITRGVISEIVGLSLAAGTLYAVADQHEIFRSVTDSIGGFIDDKIPGDTSYVDQAREQADWLLDNSGWGSRLWSVASLAAAGFGVYWLTKKGMRQLHDGFTSLRNSSYEHFDDGRTWQRHGGYTNRPSRATQNYGKPLTPVDSEENVEPLSEGEMVLINGAVLVKAVFYRTTTKNNRKRTVRIPMGEYDISWSGTDHGNFTFELPQGGRIEGLKKEGDLLDIAKLIRDNSDHQPIVRAEGKLGKNNVLQLNYVRPAYTR